MAGALSFELSDEFEALQESESLIEKEGVPMAITRPESATNLDGYGAPPIEWSRVRQVLDKPFSQAPGTGGPGRHTTWLTTINPDGAPHVMPVGAIGVDGDWYFTSGSETRKGRNMARDARCVLSVATGPFDLVVEGTAERVVDPDVLESVAEVYAAGGWPVRLDGEAFTAEYSAPAAGPPPWNLYRVVPKTIFALGTAEPYGATRFDV